ncbi:harmonin [Anopheles darlingi]|uniref:Harmonin n=1 Tax=Anopheles darlingi TaxID=43151 RepID=W5J7G4_ANODA|nr:harmonin [Anopheles darlingi]
MVDYYNARPSAHHPHHHHPSAGGAGQAPATTTMTLRNATSKTRAQRDVKSALHKALTTAAAAGGGAEGTLAGSGNPGTGNAQPRIRIVRLVRPQSHAALRSAPPSVPTSGANFGFSIRGGLEYGTGFFVSAIERDSEADRQGLKVGDQIIRVNGYQVDDAVHRELAQFIANQERLIMKVRGLGILPIKERAVDPLTWHVVSLPRDTKDTLLLEDPCCGRDMKVILSVAPRTKLGCGICKGPDWKPGIFVQFTKEGGVAREAGLRPGDQIMSCNGHSFAEASFSEAVGVMKSSHVLELIVRPSAGLDLFPGESSGYNSSASSVNGDQSPCWGDQTSKRLSIVREESISHERRRTAAATAGTELKLNPGEKSSPSIPPPPQPPQPSPVQPVKTAKTTTAPSATIAGSQAHHPRRKNTTIIEFSERGTIVNPEVKQSETKTIIVEVHRSASTGSIGSAAPSGLASNTNIIPPPPPLFADSVTPSTAQQQQQQQQQLPLASQPGMSTTSTEPANSLCSAISDELRRRAEKKTAATQGTAGMVGSVDQAALAGPAAALSELENRLKEKNCRLRPVTMAISDERHTALMDEFRAVHKRMFKNGFDNAELKQPIRGMGSSDGVDGKQHETNDPAAAPNGIRKSPKGTMGRVAASEMAKASGDSAELESIESFKLTNPQAPPARPPSYYFCPQATGPATMKKSQKPIAVTISEYAAANGGVTTKRPSDDPRTTSAQRLVQLRPMGEGSFSGGGNKLLPSGNSQPPETVRGSMA